MVRGDQDAVCSVHRSSMVTGVVESVVLSVVVPVVVPVVESIVVAGASEDMIGESIEA